MQLNALKTETLCVWTALEHERARWSWEVHLSETEKNPSEWISRVDTHSSHLNVFGRTGVLHSTEMCKWRRSRRGIYSPTAHVQLLFCIAYIFGDNPFLPKDNQHHHYVDNIFHALHSDSNEQHQKRISADRVLLTRSQHCVRAADDQPDSVENKHSCVRSWDVLFALLSKI